MKNVMVSTMLILGLQAQAVQKNCDLQDAQGKNRGTLKFFAPDTTPIVVSQFFLKCMNGAAFSYTAEGTSASIWTKINGREVFLDMHQSVGRRGCMDGLPSLPLKSNMSIGNEFGDMSIEVDMSWNESGIVRGAEDLVLKRFVLSTIGLKNPITLNVANCKLKE